MLKPKPPKQNFGGPNWDRNDLFYLNVVKHPLKLACFFYD